MNARPPSLPRTLGSIAISLGHSPLMGRLHGLLLMSKAPLSLDTLCAQSGAAKSTVSVAMRRLEGAGLVVRVAAEADRRVYWKASSSVAHALLMWFQQHLAAPLEELRLLEHGVVSPQLSETVEVLDALQAMLAARTPAE